MKDLDKFMAEWRASRSDDGTKIIQTEYDLVMSAINGTWKPKTMTPPLRLSGSMTELPWIEVARSHIGLTEIKGPKHNNWIVNGWKRLGAGWFVDDETPWCGNFVAQCFADVGIAIPAPSQFPRAKAWANWGKPCQPVYGAVAVFDRQGGGHVGFVVGESESNYYILGGNQKDAVNIMPLSKSRNPVFRWPISHSIGTRPLPKMSGGIVSTNES